MSDQNSLAIIAQNIGRLNLALGHRRGVPRVTLETATPAQKLLVIELAAWEEAHQKRLGMDSACARARRLADGEYRLESTLETGETTYAIVDDEGRRLDLRNSLGQLRRAQDWPT